MRIIRVLWRSAAQVNYVGKAANLYEDAGYKLSGASYVVNKFLGTTWLWDRVRVVGGAYGGFSDFDSHSGAPPCCISVHSIAGCEALSSSAIRLHHRDFWGCDPAIVCPQISCVGQGGSHHIPPWSCRGLVHCLLRVRGDDEGTCKESACGPSRTSPLNASQRNAYLEFCPLLDEAML